MKDKQFALNTSSIRECGLDLESKVELTARTGYDGIELWLSEIEQFLEGGREVAELRDLLVDHELQVPNIIAFFPWAHPDARFREKGLEEASEARKIAMGIGCKNLAAPPAGIKDMPGISLKTISKYYEDLLNDFRGSGVKPLLEFWGHSKVLNSLSDALDIIGRIDDPDASILVDIFHTAKGGDDFDILKRLEADQLGLIHINDYPKGGDVTLMGDEERVYPGDGAAPFPYINQMLTEKGYAGWYSLELFNKDYQKRGAYHVASTGIEKMKEVLGF